MTRFWVRLMNVYPFELDRLTIHQQQAIGTIAGFHWFDLNAAEADRVGDHLSCIFPITDNSDQQLVEVRMLVAPGSYLLQLSGETNRLHAVGVNRYRF